MANAYGMPRDGGKINEEALTRLLSKVAGSSNGGRISTTDFQVTQNGTPNMTVLVTAGDFVIPYLDYFYHAWSTTNQSVTITAADPSNPRIDRIVTYWDLSVVSSSNTNNLDAVKFMSVTGTAAGSPSAKSDSDVQTAVGAGNPWEELARVAVAAGATSITTANITDYRTQFILGGGIGGILLAQSGVVSVANDVAPLVITPKSGTFTSAYTRCKVAPTGANLTGRVNKNGVQVATFTISAGTQNQTQTGLSISFAAGDYFTLDITQIGSGTAGSSVSIVLG